MTAVETTYDLQDNIRSPDGHEVTSVRVMAHMYYDKGDPSVGMGDSYEMSDEEVWAQLPVPKVRTNGPHLYVRHSRQPDDDAYIVRFSALSNRDQEALIGILEGLADEATAEARAEYMADRY